MGHTKFEQMRAFVAPMVSHAWATFADEKSALEFHRRVSGCVMGETNPPRPHRSLAPMENLRRYLIWQVCLGISTRYRSKADRAEVLRVLKLGIDWLYQDGRSPAVDWNALRLRMVVNKKSRKPSYRSGGGEAA